jgi:hypothetical protein
MSYLSFTLLESSAKQSSVLRGSWNQATVFLVILFNFHYEHGFLLEYDSYSTSSNIHQLSLTAWLEVYLNCYDQLNKIT